MTDPALPGVLRAAASRVRTIRGEAAEVSGGLVWESFVVFNQAWQSGAASDHHMVVTRLSKDVNKIGDALGDLAAALDLGASVASDDVQAEAAEKARAAAAAAAAAKAKGGG